MYIKYKLSSIRILFIKRDENFYIVSMLLSFNKFVFISYLQE